MEKTLDDPDETDGGGYNQALPTEADFVLAYATTPGYVSWRNSEWVYLPTLTFGYQYSLYPALWLCAVFVVVSNSQLSYKHP